MVAINLMGHGHSLFQCLGVHELCIVLPFLTATLKRWVGLENFPATRRRSFSREGQVTVVATACGGQASSGTLLLSKCLCKLYCTWMLSAPSGNYLAWSKGWERLKREMVSCYGNSGIPGRGGASIATNGPRHFWACKSLKLIPPWEGSLHVYLTIYMFLGVTNRILP